MAGEGTFTQCELMMRFVFFRPFLKVHCVDLVCAASLPVPSPERHWLGENTDSPVESDHAVSFIPHSSHLNEEKTVEGAMHACLLLAFKEFGC